MLRTLQSWLRDSPESADREDLVTSLRSAISQPQPDKTALKTLFDRANTEEIDRALTQDDKEGNTGLHVAVCKLDADTLHELITKASLAAFDKVLTAPNNRESTPFSLAFSMENKAIFTTLVNRASADSIEKILTEGHIYLYMIAREFDTETLREFIRKASQETFDKALNTVDMEKNTAFSLTIAMPDKAMFTALINRASSAAIEKALTQSDGHGNTGLHVAIQQLDADTLDELITERTSQKAFDEAFATPNNAGDTPFSLALAMPDKAMFTALINKANTDVIDKALSQDDKEGDTGLHVAVRQLDANTLHELITRASLAAFDKVLTAPNNRESTPFFLAFSMENKAIFTTLVNRASASSIEKILTESHTYLHLIAQKFDIETLREFIRKASQETFDKALNTVDMKKNTAFSLTIAMPDKAMFTALINRASSAAIEKALTQSDGQRNTGLHVAVRQLNANALHELITRASQEAFGEALTTPNSQGCTPFSTAISTYPAAFGVLIKLASENTLNKAVVQNYTFTSSQKSDSYAVCSRVTTGLYLAAANNLDPVDFQLFVNKINRDVYNNTLVKLNSNGQTPLHAAMILKNSAQAKILLTTANQDTLDEALVIADVEGNTLMHLACKHPDMTFLSLLYEKAKPDIFNKALGMANKSGNCALYLLAAQERYKAIFDRCIQSATPEAISKTLAQTIVHKNQQPIFDNLITHITQAAPAVINQALMLTVRDRGDTLFHLAAANSNSHFISILLPILTPTPHLISQIITMRGTQGRTLLHVAFGKKNFPTVILEAALEEKNGVDPQRVNQALTMADFQGDSPLFLAPPSFLRQFFTTANSEMINNALALHNTKIAARYQHHLLLEFLYNQENIDPDYKKVIEIFKRRIQADATPAATSQTLAWIITRDYKFFEKLISIIPSEIINQALVIADARGNTLFHLAVRNLPHFTFKSFIQMAALALLQEKINIDEIKLSTDLDYEEKTYKKENLTMLKEMAQFVRNPLEILKEDYSKFILLCRDHLTEMNRLSTTDLKTWSTILEKTRLDVKKGRDALKRGDVDNQLCTCNLEHGVHDQICIALLEYIHDKICFSLRRINVLVYQREGNKEAQLNIIISDLAVLSFREKKHPEMDINQLRSAAEMLSLVDDLHFAEHCAIAKSLRGAENPPTSVAEMQALEASSIINLAKIKRLKYLYYFIKQSDDPDCSEIILLNALTATIVQENNEQKANADEETVSTTEVDEFFYKAALKILQKKISRQLSCEAPSNQLQDPYQSTRSPLLTYTLFEKPAVPEPAAAPCISTSSASPESWHSGRFKFHIIQ